MKTILVLMDTLNRRYLKTYNERAKGITPNINAFSKDCIIYDNHFIGSAPCMPARRDIFTGRMQFLERGGAVLNLLILRFLPYCVKMAFLRILRPITHITLKLEEKITATCSIRGIIIEDRNLIPGFPV